jgi:hypothetical protein
MHSSRKPAKPMNETEAKAKEIALAFERRRIREAMGEEAVSQIREIGEGGGYEIVSPDGRTIEVKGTKGTKPNYGFVINSQQEIQHLENGGFIYRVTDVFGSAPHIYILSRGHLSITARYRAGVRIRRGAKHEIIVHEATVV